MRRRLGNTATAISILICLATLLAWRTQPHWLGIGWARQWEFEVHLADGYTEFTLARHMTTNKFEDLSEGQFFTFDRDNSGWGTPLMLKWDHIRWHQWNILWFGTGSDENPESSASWFAVDSWVICITFLVWPVLWLGRRMKRRPQEPPNIDAKP